MEYINCFQITSLVLVTMIAIHYFSHKRLNNAENRNFVCFLAFSGVYVVLDMLSAVIAGGGSSEGCRGSALVLTLYYFCDVILTYGIFCYIRIVTGRQKEKYKWLKTCWVVLPAAMLLAVTANLRTGWLFYFEFINMKQKICFFLSFIEIILFCEKKIFCICHIFFCFFRNLCII